MTTTMEKIFEPRRELGRTGFQVSLLGIGDLADRSIEPERLVATLHRAMDAGLNLIDTAPCYEDGYSEEVVGRALKGRREAMFLVDKIDHFDRPVAGQVEASLRRLGEDHADCFLFHGVSTMADWQRLAGEGGGLEQLGACVRAGKARFAGLSSHHPEVLRAAIESGRCDVLLFPLAAFCDARYAEEILPLARRRGVGVISMKTFGAGKLLGDTSGYNQPLKERPRGKFSSGGEATPEAPQLPRLTVEDCLHYTLSLEPDVALLGLSYPNEQEAAFAAARSFRRPLSPEQMADIRRLAALAIEGKGEVWWDPRD